MSKIEQLIQQYCPDGVEWKKLGEVGNNLDKKRKPITAGKREAGTNGGRPGDLYIEFTVREHEFFERDEEDIYIDLPLTITEAVLGCKKEVPTLYGNVALTIPAGTSTNDKLRLKGKGVENVSTKKKGDMYVVANVMIPEKLNRDQKKIFEELSKTTLDNTPEFRKYYKFLNK